MIKTIKLHKGWFVVHKVLPVTALLFFAAVFAFCCFYVFSSHGALVQWFTGLNSCFYKNATWSNEFFTPRIKSDGNMYSVLAMLVCGAGTIWIMRQQKKAKAQKKDLSCSINYDTADLLPVLSGLATTIILWWWGCSMARPAYDEVFSAQHVAGIHPFQGVAYYMLPNNHIFFNLLNNLIFHPVANKVFSGRILSLTAYCAFITVVFYWFKNILGNRWLALLVAITLALQFQVWGFSFQARGYELYLLAETGMVISLMSYMQQSHNRWLYINASCSVVAYFCIPSFFYLHAAQLVFMLGWQMSNKQQCVTFWKYQLVVFCVTFLLYLPALCFSGLETIAHNHYLLSMESFNDRTRTDFLKWMIVHFRPFVTELFSGVAWQGVDISLLLFGLPLLLLADKKKGFSFMFGIFYVVMWLLFFATVVVMKRLPFERNLTGQFSITLAGVVLATYRITAFIGRRMAMLRYSLFCGILLLMVFHFLGTNATHLKEGLYGYDVNAKYDEVKSTLAFIPADAVTGVSDDQFYSYYVLRHNGNHVLKCPGGSEQYYIKQPYEHIPKPGNNHYRLIKTTFELEVWELNGVSPEH